MTMPYSGMSFANFDRSKLAPPVGHGKGRGITKPALRRKKKAHR